MKILNYGSLNIDYTYSVDHFVRGGETQSSKELVCIFRRKGLKSVHRSTRAARQYGMRCCGTGRPRVSDPPA